MSENTIRKFEAEFANWVGVKRCWAFWKGRFAMYAILRAMGIGEGDEVILPGYTCISAVISIKYAGATCVYVDIEPATFNMDPEKIEGKITPRTRLISAQHTYGYPAEMDAILDIAGRHGIPVIEDACHAMGSFYKGRKVGTIVPTAYWSTQWTKCFTTGFGGMATSNDDNLAAKIDRVIREEAHRPSFKEGAMLTFLRGVHRAAAFPKTMGMGQGFYRWLVNKKLLSINPPVKKKPEFEPEMFKRMGAGQARAGRRHVRRLDADCAHRRRLTRLYTDLLRERGWDLPKIPDTMDPCLVRYPILVADKERAVSEARRRWLEVGNWFDRPLHQASAGMEMYDYFEGMCPVAERVARQVVNLPTHPRTSEKVARQVVDLICEIGPAVAAP